MTPAHILGAVLAGGQSRRFGSDKAKALLDGRPLIEHVMERLKSQVADLVVVGRTLSGSICLADRPMPGLGPLGGLSAALHYGAALGFDAVLSVSCDTPLLPRDLARRLSPTKPSFVSGNFLIGLWPTALAELLDAYLASTSDLSMRGWTRFCEAREVTISAAIENVNRPHDLMRLQREEAIS